MKLSKLDTPNIQALYSSKLRDGLKPSSVSYSSYRRRDSRLE
jgi:hypothetical protein